MKMKTRNPRHPRRPTTPLPTHHQNRRIITLHLPKLHPGQREVAQSQARFCTLACGRRWGKSVLGIDRLIEMALYGYPVAWMSPTYRMLVEVWRTVKTTMLPLAVRISEQQHRIELNTGGSIEMWSLQDPDIVRGRKYRRVVIDEAAMVRDLKQAWQAVIRPTLTDMQGDAWLLSTPRGRNFFWECFQRGIEGENSKEGEWRSWQMPTSSNPHIPAPEIEAMQSELPERVYLQEIQAQFLDDSGGVFRRISEAATAELLDAPLEGHSYVMGIDWARQNDYSVFVVMDAETKTVVALDRMNHIDYAVQVERLAALAQHWSPTVIVAEQNSIGVPLIEQLQRRGLPVQPFVTTNASKVQIIDRLALAFENGTIALPNDAVLLGELMAFEMERLESGALRYSAPPGTHDDCVMALALCYAACEQSGPLVLW